MNLNKLSRFLYGAARTTRDIQAVTKGPEAIAKRAVRKTVYRSTNRYAAKAMRSLWRG